MLEFFGCIEKYYIFTKVRSNEYTNLQKTYLIYFGLYYGYSAFLSISLFSKIICSSTIKTNLFIYLLMIRMTVSIWLIIKIFHYTDSLLILTISWNEISMILAILDLKYNRKGMWVITN